MNKDEWDRHERTVCETCAYRRRRCPVMQIMKNDPEDPACAYLFERLGRCSQHAEPQKPKRKPRPIRRT